MAAETNAHYQQRLRNRARALWESEGRPSGREGDYLEKAREALAIEDNPLGASEPPETSGERVLHQGSEPNQGEKTPKRRPTGRGE